MCTVSMVYDYYHPKFYAVNQDSPSEVYTLIKEFKDCLEAARKVDQLTEQADCVDPEKQKLDQTVEELERKLDSLEKE